MPEPTKAGHRYMPGLDGLRAIAVLAVLAYHAGIDAIPGGFLGVSMFFTLSGYLITDLILHRRSTGEFTFGSFWLARARRLLPAVIVMVVVVMAWVTVIGPHQRSDFRLSSVSALLYVNNWWAVFHDVSYFAQFDAPGPLNHLWSLSVEEQFYLIWPVVLLGLVKLIRERPGSVNRPRLALAILALAAASFALMLALYEPGTDPSRVYYGTDTRAAELLIGATLAALWPSHHLRASITSSARGVIDGIGLAGLVVIAFMLVRVEEFDSFLYRGGFVALGIAVAAIVGSVAHPASRLGPILGCRPMRWVGARSYGIYLWHFPIFILTNPAGAVEPGPVRIALQVSATFAVAALSWWLVEDPIRRGALGRIWAQWRDARERGRPTALVLGGSPLRYATLAFAVVLLVPAIAGFAGAGVRAELPASALEVDIAKTVTAGSETPTTAPGSSSDTGPSSDSESDSESDTTSDTTPAGAGSPDSTPDDPAADAATLAAARPTTSSCTSVVHLGDSTSAGLLQEVYIPDESEQMPAQYQRVGVATQHYEIKGGVGIFEGYKKNPSGSKAAQVWRDDGYRGCWVIALGLADAAVIEKGAKAGAQARIDKMMSIADGDPVMWLTVRTVAETGYARAEVMQPWNDALEDACADYPNMRVYDWAADVRDDWFGSDGVHNNPTGLVAKARNIADALAVAFPAGDAGPTATASCRFDL